jgi:hypothetical protein
MIRFSADTLLKHKELIYQTGAEANRRPWFEPDTAGWMICEMIEATRPGNSISRNQLIAPHSTHGVGRRIFETLAANLPSLSRGFSRRSFFPSAESELEKTRSWNPSPGEATINLLEEVFDFRN